MHLSLAAIIAASSAATATAYASASKAGKQSKTQSASAYSMSMSMSVGPNPSDITLWEKKCVDRETGRLSLTLVNNLNDEWQDAVEVAIAGWSQSKALAITVERGGVGEDRCKPRPQSCTIVLCNGNYGDNGWVGDYENEVDQVTNRITSSVIMMNDYYQESTSYIIRESSSCHEIGHGFGLPSTDPIESCKGQEKWRCQNCMDYTITPFSIPEYKYMFPGESNYEKLRDAYLK